MNLRICGRIRESKNRAYPFACLACADDGTDDEPLAAATFKTGLLAVAPPARTGRPGGLLAVAPPPGQAAHSGQRSAKANFEVLAQNLHDNIQEHSKHTTKVDEQKLHVQMLAAVRARMSTMEVNEQMLNVQNTAALPRSRIAAPPDNVLGGNFVFARALAVRRFAPWRFGSR